MKDLIKCKDLIILQIGQINFIKGLIDEKLVLELKSGSIEKFGVFGNRIEFFQSNCVNSGVKLKTIESLMVN